MGNNLEMDGATVTGELNMDSLHIGSSLFMRAGATFATVILRSAQITGQLDMSQATVTGELDMNGLHIGSSLLMHTGATFATVDLRGAQIMGQLDMSQATVTGDLDMDSLHVGSSLFLGAGNFVKAPPISIIFAAIGINLDLSGAQLPSLNLTGTTIGGELRLTQGSAVPTWQPGAQLILRNTKVGALQEAHELNPAELASHAFVAWPETLELSGFAYDRVGGWTVDTALDIAARDVDWWKAWLRKQTKYAPQPYEHLAKVLRETGYQAKATAILYAGKERARTEARSFRWLGLTLLKYTIGYGYYPWRALYWTLACIFLGMVALRFRLFGPGPAHPLRYWGLAYSVDMFLPIIELNKNHDNLGVQGGTQVYFYFHKIFGYVLAGFLLAGLSGLTK